MRLAGSGVGHGGERPCYPTPMFSRDGETVLILLLGTATAGGAPDGHTGRAGRRTPGSLDVDPPL